MTAHRLYGLLFLFIGLALACPAFAQTPTVLSGAEELIARADALGANRDYDGAIRLLRGGIERYPRYARVYLSLAAWQEYRGLAKLTVPGEIRATTQEAVRAYLRKVLYTKPAQDPATMMEMFETFGQAIMYLPETAEVQRRVVDATTYDFPLKLGNYGALALPGDPTPVTYALTDAGLDASLRGVQQGLITMQPLPTTSLYTQDPKSKSWTFQRMMLVYEYVRPERCWRLRFRVMWQDVPGQQAQRTELAQRTAKLLLRLSGMAQAYTGLTPRFTADQVTNVWLAEKGVAGGEAIENNIYLYAVSAPRSPFEWVREVAHEYGHQTLPAVGGYEKPEWGANGRLGEYLYMRWLVRNLSPKAEEHPWVAELDAAELQKTRFERVIRQYANLGPEMPQMRGTDAAAMDAFIGMALYTEQLHGSKWLADRLGDMTNPQFSDGGGFLRQIIAQESLEQTAEHPVLTLPLGELPANIPYWFYLRKGDWRGVVEVTEGSPAAVKVEVDGKPCKMEEEGFFTATSLAEGWHRFRVIPPTDSTMVLTTLTLIGQ